MGLFRHRSPSHGAMVKHNHAIQKCHFHKKWQTRVKTWLEQPMRAKRRRLNRLTKAAKISPRPISGALRPAVRCPTVKYNRKVRFGRGFTLDELKALVSVPSRPSLLALLSTIAARTEVRSPFRLTSSG